MLKDVVQERGRRLAVRVGGKRQVFPTRDNFCSIAQRLVMFIRDSFKRVKSPPAYVWIDIMDGELHLTIFGSPESNLKPVIYDVAKRFAGDARQSPPPNGKTIRDELAQALASLADEEREFIFAYYRRNASQKRREKFQRKERKQRRNDGN